MDWLTKMINDELVKVIIDVPSPTKVIIDMVVCYHKILELIVIN